MRKRVSILFSLLMLFALLGATDQGNITVALSNLCDFFQNVLPIAILVVVVLAGVVFAAGQAMGAETRARANVWATNMLIGAIIAAVVYVLAPWFLGIIYQGSTFDWSSCGSSST